MDENTEVYTMRKGVSDIVIYNVASVKERFGGLAPQQLIDYKGLRGDPSPDKGDDRRTPDGQAG